MQKNLALLCLVFTLLTGCSKKSVNENCPPVEAIEITTNSPVVVGWPLTLQVPDIPGVLYHWKGPNGYEVKYDYYSNSAHEQFRSSLTLADAGDYSLELLDENDCPVYRGTVKVEVTNSPAQPCNLAPNTGTSTFANVGNGSGYSTWIYGTAVEVRQPGEVINLHFPGSSIKPGIYKTSGYWPLDEKTVGLYISLFPYDFISRPDQLVYVSKNSSGKLEFGYCDHIFSNPLGGATPKASGRFVER